jgi:hypothetical protein
MPLKAMPLKVMPLKVIPLKVKPPRVSSCQNLRARGEGGGFVSLRENGATFIHQRMFGTCDASSSKNTRPKVPSN